MTAQAQDSNRRRRAYALSAAVALWCALVPLTKAVAAVDLVWSPAEIQTAEVGEVVEIDLVALSDEPGGEAVATINAIISWNPSYLELAGHVDNGTYEWMASVFPEDEPPGGDGLNEPYGEVPANDGDALYLAQAQMLPPPGTPAMVTDEGLLVTTFRFRPLREGLAAISLLEEAGEVSATRVLSGTEAGLDITGTLGAPALIDVAFDCEAPVAIASGCRYLSITPATSTADVPVALLVEGDQTSEDTACIAGYVQQDGALGELPVYLPANTWQTIHVTGSEIMPESTYDVTTVCAHPEEDFTSDTVSATTWLWGDVNHDGIVWLDDVITILEYIEGVSGAAVQAVDLAGCSPNRAVDDDDVSVAVDAAGGASFPCLSPCAPDVIDLTDYAAFQLCLEGPNEDASPDCVLFDTDMNDVIDMMDYSDFQNLFGTAP